MSDRIHDIVGRVRSFMESDVYPLEEQAGRKEFYALLPALKEKRQKVKEMGLWTPSVVAPPRGSHVHSCRQSRKS